MHKFDWKGPLLLFAFIAPCLAIAIAIEETLEKLGVYEYRAEQIGIAASIIIWFVCVAIVSHIRAKRKGAIYELQKEIDRLRRYEQDYEKLYEKYIKLADREAS